MPDRTMTLLPQMIRIGIVTTVAVVIETLETRLRSAVVEARVERPAQICARMKVRYSPRALALSLRARSWAWGKLKTVKPSASGTSSAAPSS